MRLTTVGTGTAAPHPRRVSAAHLVEGAETRLLLDCGSGSVHRMAQLGIDWSGITHVGITHFHPDHIADLPLLLMGWRWGQLPARSAPATLIGPPGFRTLLERMAATYGEWLLAPGFPLIVQEITPDSPLLLPGRMEIRTITVPHSAESVAYSVAEAGRRLVYTGDTGPSEALGDWAADCDVLLAECSLPDEMAIPAHLTPRQAGALAARARTHQLVLTHFYPPVEAVDIAAEVAECFPGPTVVATDGWSIAF
jgi:ribonuclease BN (tRNA processing enzyme)